MLLVPKCPVCRRPGASPCASCAADLPAPDVLPPPPLVDGLVTLCGHEGGAREIVHAIKYRNDRTAARWAAAGLSELVASSLRWHGSMPWMLTWAPTSRRRRRERGYDQAQRLAVLTGRRLRVKPRDLLRRLPGPPQAGRSAEQRWSGPRFQVRAAPAPTVVIIDDVVTTGATASAAARVLRARGAECVLFVGISRSSLKVRAERDEDDQDESQPQTGCRDFGRIA